jgi:hypothetical protein
METRKPTLAFNCQVICDANMSPVPTTKDE